MTKRWIPVLVAVVLFGGLAISQVVSRGVGVTGWSSSGTTTSTSNFIKTSQPGTLTATAIGPVGDNNTGINFPAADTIDFVANGILACEVTSTGALTCPATKASFAAGVAVLDGNGTTPGVSFSSSSSTGISLSAAATLGFVCGGVACGSVSTALGYQSQIGTSSSSSTLIGTVLTNITPVGNIGAGEDNLMLTNLSANSLVVTTRGVHLAWSGAVANDINAKTLKFYFGTTVMISLAIPVSIAGHWFADIRVVRTGLSAQMYTVSVTVSNTATNAVSGFFTAQGTMAETETSSILMKATATATTDNDLTQVLATTEFF